MLSSPENSQNLEQKRLKCQQFLPKLRENVLDQTFNRDQHTEKSLLQYVKQFGL